jgi:hypothetical protein
MKELNLTVYTMDAANKVTMTATFDSHEDAVRFHNQIADVCNNSTPKSQSMAGSWFAKRLSPPRTEL